MHTHTFWGFVPFRQLIGVPCWVFLKEMIITLQLSHVTEPCLYLPCPSSKSSKTNVNWQQHWLLHAICTSVLSGIIQNASSFCFALLWVTVDIHCPKSHSLSSLQRVVTPTRGRCCPSSALPRGSVFSEWHAWLSTAATSEWFQPEPH